jgi:uncharacterized protein
MELLQRSQHLHVIPRSGDHAVYHKLFGNLCLLDQDAVRLLDRFAQPAAAEEVARDARDAALVEEFRERMFLVAPDFDERTYVEDDKAYRAANLDSGYLLKGIQLVLTNDCNLGCSYCFQETIKPIEPPAPSAGQGRRFQLPVLGETKSSGCGSTGSSSQSSSGGGDKRMSAETAISTVRHALAAVKDAGNSALAVEFFGGEPLVNWPAIEAVLDVFGGESDGVRMFYSMTTNATLMSDEIARKLRAHGVTVTVSFDSPKNVNRTTKRGTSADAQIIAGLETLARNESILTFNTVVSVGNVNDLDIDGLLEHAQRFKVRQIGVILDLDVKPYEDRPAMDKVVDSVLEICEKARAYQIPITGYWHMIYEQIVGEQALNLQKGYKTCAAEGCKLSFEPNGDVTGCKTTEKPIGNAERIRDVFQSNWYRVAAMKAYETTPMCRGCMVEGFCSGLCMGTLQKNYNDINALVPPACEVYRKLTERLVQGMPVEKVSQLTLAAAGG